MISEFTASAGRAAVAVEPTPRAVGPAAAPALGAWGATPCHRVPATAHPRPGGTPWPPERDRALQLAGDREMGAVEGCGCSLVGVTVTSAAGASLLPCG